ncbi:MAG: hypothetical protein M1275_02775, partial [Patescibacteria group bacterium]|nr:hypothetical protein [Patescibacteria group bacterium]
VKKILAPYPASTSVGQYLFLTLHSVSVNRGEVHALAELTTTTPDKTRISLIVYENGEWTAVPLPWAQGRVSESVCASDGVYFILYRPTELQGLKLYRVSMNAGSAVQVGGLADFVEPSFSCSSSGVSYVTKDAAGNRTYALLPYGGTQETVLYSASTFEGMSLSDNDKVTVADDGTLLVAPAIGGLFQVVKGVATTLVRPTDPPYGAGFAFKAGGRIYFQVPFGTNSFASYALYQPAPSKTDYSGNRGDKLKLEGSDLAPLAVDGKTVIPPTLSCSNGKGISVGSDLVFTVPASTDFPAGSNGCTLEVGGTGGIKFAITLNIVVPPPPPPPLILPKILAAANVFDFEPATEFSAGQIVSLFGQNFGCSGTSLGKVKSLGGCTVSLQGRLGLATQATFYYASDFQLNIQLPAKVSKGSYNLVVANAKGTSNPLTIDIVPSKLDFVSDLVAGYRYVRFVKLDGSIVGPDNPARGGEYLLAFGTG